MTLTIEIHGQSDPDLAREILTGELSFGQRFADLMVCVKHDESRGWHDAMIVPYGPLAISPAAKCLHYGLEVFEGLKAYRQKNGQVALFRPDLNARRLNVSAGRLRLPTVPESLQLRAMMTLVDSLRHFVPDAAGATLYLRPIVIATEPTLGVSPSGEHLYQLCRGHDMRKIQTSHTAKSISTENTFEKDVQDAEKIENFLFQKINTKKI